MKWVIFKAIHYDSNLPSRETGTRFTVVFLRIHNNKQALMTTNLNEYMKNHKKNSNEKLWIDLKEVS